MLGFKLTDEIVAEGFSGGSVVYDGVGHLFDVKAAIDEGSGAIYTEDVQLAAILRGYPALQEIAPSDVPSDATPVVLPFPDVASTAPASPPWVPQVPNDLPQVTVGVVQEAPAQEETAQHADEAEQSATAEEAIAAGEAVSGQQSSQGQQSEVPTTPASTPRSRR